MADLDLNFPEMPVLEGNLPQIPSDEPPAFGMSSLDHLYAMNPVNLELPQMPNFQMQNFEHQNLSGAIHHPILTN